VVPLEEPSDKVESGLREQIARAPGGRGAFLVYLQAQADLSGADQIEDWIERGRWVYKTLWETAQASQAPLTRALDRRIQSQAADGYRRFYIVNALLVTAGTDVLDELAARSDVAAIRAAAPIRRCPIRRRTRCRPARRSGPGLRRPWRRPTSPRACAKSASTRCGIA
jgi:hypothetical protein